MQFAMRGGSLCLDFHNHLRRVALDELESEEAWERVLSWAAQADIADRPTIAALRGSTDEQAIAALLRRLRRQWMALHLVLLDLARGAQPDAEAVHLLNSELSEALRYARIVPAGAGFGWGWSDEARPERLLWPVMRSAAELLTSGDLGRLRVCDNEECGWLFVDRSRNRSRRWCDMQDCGNVAKVRRFRARQRGEKTAPHG